MLRPFYTLIFYLGMPLVMLRLLYRARKSPGYGQRWGERFGFSPDLTPQAKTIWLHTVSVGETIAAAPLVHKLLATRPNYIIVITTMTPTGSDQVNKLYAKEIALNRVVHCYAPYDLPSTVNRFLSRIHPSVAIFMETELWPNTIAACQRNNIPTLLTNARLSERSAEGYARIGSLARDMIQQLYFIAAQTEDDAERFIKLGFPRGRMQVTGTLKYDITVSDELLTEASILRQLWLDGRTPDTKILIAASTHAGEDEQILAAFRKLRAQLPELLLILVPRQPERFDSVYELVKKEGWQTVRRSLSKTPEGQVTKQTDVLLGDTMGELMLLYATADLAFVGGSLVEHGGHNVLEPAALGLPVITGPYVFNFADVNKKLEQEGALFTVNNAEQLAEKSLELLSESAAWQQASDATQQVLRTNGGALDRQLELVQLLLK